MMDLSHFFQAGTGRILITQSVITLIGIAVSAFFGFAAAYSALLGGFACIVPNAYALWRVFGADKSINPYDSRIFGIMLRAEMVKFAFTGAVFAAIFWLIRPIEPIALFSVFTVAMFAGWIEAGLKIR